MAGSGWDQLAHEMAGSVSLQSEPSRQGTAGVASCPHSPDGRYVAKHFVIIIGCRLDGRIRGMFGTCVLGVPGVAHRNRKRFGRTLWRASASKSLRGEPGRHYDDPLTDYGVLLPGSGDIGRHARVPKAANVLADDLRRHILMERLPVGAVLPSEPELVDSTEFSRGTVRQALRLLESEGLITIKRGPSGGIRVSRPDVTHVTRSFALMVALSDAPLADLFALRLALEPAAAALAAQAASDEQREGLLELATEEPDRQIEHNVDFHVALAGATNNELFRVALSSMMELTLWQSQGDDLRGEERGLAVAAHRKIARLVAAGDAARAERATRRHVEAFRELMASQGRLDRPIVRRANWGTDAAWSTSGSAG